MTGSSGNACSPSRRPCLASSRHRRNASLPSYRSLLPASASQQWCSLEDRKSTRLNSSHQIISYAVFCLKKKKTRLHRRPPPVLTDPVSPHSEPLPSTARGPTATPGYSEPIAALGSITTPHHPFLHPRDT